MHCSKDLMLVSNTSRRIINVSYLPLQGLFQIDEFDSGYTKIPSILQQSTS